MKKVKTETAKSSLLVIYILMLIPGLGWRAPALTEEPETDLWP